MTPACDTILPTTLDTPTPTEAVTQPRTAEAVLLEIRLDTTDDPQRFLEEILVPFGGE